MPSGRPHAILGCTLLAVSWACVDHHEGAPERPSTPHPEANDASTPPPVTPNTPLASTTVSTTPSEEDAGPPPVEDKNAWLAAEHFRIAVDRRPCYGVCPSFSVHADERGHVAYRGLAYVARPGYYEVDVPPETVRQVFVDALDAGYLELGRRYAEAEDGCTSVSTDNPSSIFTLSAGDRSKEVQMYWGCETEVESQLQQLDKAIERVTTAGRFLYPNPGFERCEGDRYSSGLALNWVIVDTTSTMRKEFGLLTLDPSSLKERHWKITSCDGEAIANGWAVRTNCTEELLPPKDVDAYFAWPGVEDPQGVAIITRTGLEHEVTVRLLNLLDQKNQWAYEGSACGTAPP